MSRRRRKAEISDDPDHLFDHGLYIPTRTIYIGAVGESEDGADEVNHRLASRVIKSIHILEGNKEPINVILNNPGGDEYHGLAIYDALRHTKCKVYISVFGHAMSMASIILQAGDKRLLSANATLMIHDGTIPMVNTDQEAKNGEKWADESRRLRELFYKIYQKRMREVKPRVTIREIEDMCKYDNLIPAREAVKLGLADAIMYERNFVRKRANGGQK